MSLWTLPILGIFAAVFLCRAYVVKAYTILSLSKGINRDTKAEAVDAGPRDQVAMSQDSKLDDMSQDIPDEVIDHQITPKATPIMQVNSDDKIPSLVLEDKHDKDARAMPPPPIPVINKTISQSSTSTGSSSKPVSKVSESQTMPSPSSTTLRPARTNPSSTSLSVPTREPARLSPQSQTHTSSSPSASTLPSSSPNKPGKVLLSPGHSPLDWAALISSSKNLSGLPPGVSLQRIPPSMLKQADGKKGRPAWSAYRGKVYNLGAYLPFHPGGPGQLLRAAGRDGGALFEEVHAWVNWENMMAACLVGMLVSEP